jgi:ABC-2 type transport system permease protein
MKDLKHVWLIALKDLKIFSRDRASLFFFILFPFLFITLFNFLLSGSFVEDQRLELHVLTREATGGMSHQIINAMVTPNETLLQPGEPVIILDEDYEADRQAVTDGKLGGFLAFPVDFTQSLMADEPVNLEIFANAGNLNVRTALNSLAYSITDQISATHVTINATVQLLVASGTIPADQGSIDNAVQTMLAKALAGGAETAGPSITFQPESVGEVKAVNASNYVVPGYLVMFVFFAAAVAAEAIVKERQNHTLERLLSTSVSRTAILGGIFTGSTLKGLVQIIIFWVVGIALFHVDMGQSPLGVIILSMLMVILSSAFAVMLATFVRTQRSAGSLATITSLVMAPLGGCWWPSFLYPHWLQNVAKIIPHTWATEGFNKMMLFGADFSAAVPNMLALLVFAVIFGVIAIWRFRTSSV